MTIEELEKLRENGVTRFLQQHLKDDPEQFALKFNAKKDIPVRAIAEQIYCYRKAAQKLPSFTGKEMLFEKTALEQSSGQPAAEYKASLIGGDRLIDITGGLGIDCYFMAAKFREAVYCEKNPLLAELFLYNSEKLPLKNVSVNRGDSIEILKAMPDNYFDWIYADPARRDSTKRFIGLRECSPDVVSNIALLMSKGRNIMIKASPALEFEEVRKQIARLSGFIVLSVENECKEVLLLINAFTDSEEISIKAVMINSQGQAVIIESSTDVITERKISDPLCYFYEPDAAIIKARLTPVTAAEYSLYFINESVDYLTSDTFAESFPGRSFRVIETVEFNKRKFREFLVKHSISAANIARRDFPDAPEVIRKKYSLKDGGDEYLFFTKDRKRQLIVLLCRKIQRG